MREFRRVFGSRVWLGVLALLLVCNVALYAFDQSSRLNVPLGDYNERNEQWTETLAALTPEQGLAALQAQQDSGISWFIAQLLVQDEAAGVLDQEELASYRAQFPDLDAQMAAVRAGQVPEEDWAQNAVVERWMARLEYRQGYEARIASVAEQAQRIRSNPLFSKPGSFEYRNAEKTEADFGSISGITFSGQPNDVMESLIDNRANLIFSLCLVAVTVVLLLEPRRLGLELVERGCANGRCVLTLRRTGILLGAAFVGAALMIGSLLAAGMALYGQGIPLTEPVQTMAYFQNWTANTSIGGFLVWMVLFRTGGLWLTGLLLWLALSRFPSLPVGLVVSGAFLLLEYRWFTSYGVNDAGYPLASVNLFHLLSAEEVAGRYLNYNVFGYPVNERVVLPVLMVLFLGICAGALLLSAHFARGVRRSGRLARLWERLAVALRRRRRCRGLWRYEGRKGLIYSGGILLLAAGLLFLWQLEAPNLWMDQEEAMLAEYTRLYAGELSEDTLTEIELRRDEAWENYESMLRRGGEASLGVDLSAYQARCNALDRLVERYQTLLEQEEQGAENLQLVDETPLERIYGATGKTLRLQGSAAALLLLCFLLPGFFAPEERYGLRLTLLSAARGRDQLWRIKARWAFGLTGLVWLGWSGRELLLLRSVQVRWASLGASGQSLSYWNEGLGTLPIGIYIAGLYLLRLVGLLAACGVMLLIASRFGALLTAGGLGTAALLLPQVLALMGADWLENVSWCARLAGSGLTMKLVDWIWLALWLMGGTAAAVVSRAQWRRYRA